MKGVAKGDSFDAERLILDGEGMTSGVFSEAVLEARAGVFEGDENGVPVFCGDAGGVFLVGVFAVGDDAGYF